MKYIQSFETNKYVPEIGDVVIYKDYNQEKTGKWVYVNKIGPIKDYTISRYIIGDINTKSIYQNNWVSRTSILRLAKQKDIDKYLLEIEANKFNI
jgi:hypothetical protein